MRIRVAVLALAALAGCGDGTESSERAVADAEPVVATSTTTSTTEKPGMPTEFELDIMGAYEQSWEAYRWAMRYFDTSKLADIFAGRALELALDEVEEVRAANTPVRIDVRKKYRIQQVKDDTVIVWDTYRNHSVLLDAKSLRPIEPDPDEIVEQAYILTLIDGRWMVTDVYDADDVNITYTSGDE